jgi:hypothetical protein
MEEKRIREVAAQVAKRFGSKIGVPPEFIEFPPFKSPNGTSAQSA